MAVNPELIYWDSNVFLAVLDKKDLRQELAIAVLDEVSSSKGRKKIVTSAISRVEVAFVQTERDRRTLNNDIERKIDDLWNDDSVIEVIEISDQIALDARKLIRRSIERGNRTIKPADSIHLASAFYISAKWLHTFNVSDFAPFQGERGLTICEPFVESPRLPGIH